MSRASHVEYREGLIAVMVVRNADSRPFRLEAILTFLLLLLVVVMVVVVVEVQVRLAGLL